MGFLYPILSGTANEIWRDFGVSMRVHFVIMLATAIYYNQFSTGGKQPQMRR